jgi:hypothetical protein
VSVQFFAYVNRVKNMGKKLDFARIKVFVQFFEQKTWAKRWATVLPAIMA